MDTPLPLDDEQTRLWNGHAGHAWVRSQALLDCMFQPFEDLLVDAVGAAAATRVLDVGCGTGSTTLAIARRLAMRGRCTGIDISAPMITAARDRADRARASARFLLANAQEHRFEPGGYDMVVSRFGVMFFDDPVRAFGNLRRASRDGAVLRFIAWRTAAENPFMTAAERAAAPLLPDLPARQPDAPGQFAFADPHRVHHILSDSGWDEIDLQPIDVPCSFPASGLDEYLTQLGPVGVALQRTTEPLHAQVVQAVRAAFDPYLHGTDVRFTAACWTVGAKASPAWTPAQAPGNV
ncbi:class I SAM-dependent methyltransferase [Caldimonas brevitalea]|uniref:SAM-dependent methyltransferase n=1 Tax=Caldimonas brevitalea TaxID=413882 RepID=A0A0G3BQX4_9BURK|nr:class I SAM-dependent methyltransferase [Caldimonas brevitalea]AKJ31822.1 SAM-dependent methyltransferase [Caldimonas brevitalea]